MFNSHLEQIKIMKNKSKYSLSIKTLFTIFIQLITSGVCFGQARTEKIEELMHYSYQTGQFNGAVMVAEHGKIIYSKGFGLANMDWDIPNQATTKFRLGSITKQFTALLILQLVEQGKIKLSEPIRTYLPDYPKSAGSKVTIHHLLSHSSGIRDYTTLSSFRNGGNQKAYTPAALIKLFSELPLDFTPGQKYSYSNSGYVLLGYIIEKVSGKTYSQCLQESILSPLKMINTGYEYSDSIIQNRANGYDVNRKKFSNAAYINMDATYAAGALYSTTEDLFLWDQALYSTQLLSSKSMDLLFTQHIPVDKNSSYGYGWFVGDVSNVTEGKLRVVQHSGSLPGFVTRVSRMPADKNLIILLNNTSSAPLREISDAIRSILYNKPYSLPKLSFAKLILEVMRNEGLSSGVEKIKEFKNSNLYTIYEIDINEAGYQLLQSGKVKEAIEVLKLNLEVFPRSGNAYDSLAEAYLKDGNKEKAILNYKKAVELDSKNKNAKKMLKKISKLM